MSDQGTAASTRAAARAPGAKRRRKAQRSTSLFAHGEPMVWLNGGALALAVLMILGLLGLVLAQGLPSFWPARVEWIETVDGRRLAGEEVAREDYSPGEQAFGGLPGEQGARARAAVEARGGTSTRQLLRSGNFELTGTHFTWVSDFEIARATQPEWMLVVERLEWGRFYGEPRAITLDGERRSGTPQELWLAFDEHHAAVRERWRERRALAKDEVGRVNARLRHVQQTLREVELEHGRDSVQWRAAAAEADSGRRAAEEEFGQLTRQIAQLRDRDARSSLELVTADGSEKSIPLEEIVRAYPANRLGLSGRAAVYAARAWEFLSDEPRESNSEGGVFPAIFGTVLMTLIMCVFVVPFGVLAALYLREYARPGPIVGAVRIAINNLAGVPSIVFGVFGLGFFCYIVGASIDDLFYRSVPEPTFGKGGLLWASATLALLTLPVVIVPTEEALAAVPSSMREGSYACGATKWQTIWRIVLPRALPGIMTGMILALARGAGEVAPLMLVGAVKLAPELPLDLGDWSGSLGPLPSGPLHAGRSFMHLGFHIYDLGFQSQNSEAAKPMVYTTTLLLIGLVVLLNLLAIGVRARLRRRFQGAAL